MQTFYDSCLFILYQQSEKVNQTKNATLILSIRKRETVTVSLFRRIEISSILYGAPYGVKRDAGYGDGKIVFKYAAFSVLSCLISSIVGLLVGIFLLPHAIFPAFSSELFMPALASTLHPVSGLWASLCFLPFWALRCSLRFRMYDAGLPKSCAPRRLRRGGKSFWKNYLFFGTPCPSDLNRHCATCSATKRIL